MNNQKKKLMNRINEILNITVGITPKPIHTNIKEVQLNLLLKLFDEYKLEVKREILEWIWDHRTASNEDTLFAKFKIKDFKHFKDT